VGKIKIAALAAFGAMMSAGPASAAVVINPDGSATIGSGDIGQGFQFNIKGTSGDFLTNLTSTLMFELIGAGGGALTFRYTLDNTSTGQNIYSSIGVLGFDVAPDATLTVLSGSFALGSKGNFSGLGKREFCLFEGSNCNGSGSAGVYVNEAPNVGTFKLFYGDPLPATVTFSNAVTRWQRTGINANGSASGTGPAMVVPEPGTWALMLIGFGFVGGALRSHRRTRVAFAPLA
jgi:hypothetical protein